jgi:predicted RNA-binding Zn-ribbon protein involved in translation (DUF1610 family)
MKKKISELSKEEMVELIKNANSINEILKQLKVNANGSGAYKTFRNHCNRLGIEPPTYNNGNQVIGPKIELIDILVENSTYQNISRLKQRLVRSKILDYKCVKCGNTGEWMNEPITLQLDHINGVNNDNRIENLRFLCPNCHTQTTTHGGKNVKKII